MFLVDIKNWECLFPVTGESSNISVLVRVKDKASFNRMTSAGAAPTSECAINDMWSAWYPGFLQLLRGGPALPSSNSEPQPTSSLRRGRRSFAIGFSTAARSQVSEPGSRRYIHSTVSSPAQPGGPAGRRGWASRPWSLSSLPASSGDTSV